MGRRMKAPNGAGSVHRLPGRRRRPFRARVTTGWTPEGKQIFYTVGYFETEREAQRALADYLERPIGERRDVTLGQLYEEWSSKAYQTLDRSTVNGYKACWKRISKLADEPVRLIRTSHLQRVIDDMVEEGLNRSSLEKAKTLCGILLNIAVNDDIITTNYARAIKLPPARKPKKETFTDLEIHQIEKLATAGDIWAGTVMILLYTGMRVGELVSLTRFQVDPNTWVITGGIKTDAGKDRPMPVHPKILPYVQYWYNTEGPRLIHRDGKPISVHYYRASIYYPVLKRAGITRHLTPHVCRHTFATLLNRAGVQPRYIQALMGHSDYAVTANTYTHPAMEELRRAIEAI